MFKQIKTTEERSGGYTIIETMIAVSLFIIIIMSGMGALLNANLLHQKSQSMRSIIDNLSFTMDDISRNLRVGYNYRCINDNNFATSISVPKSCAAGTALAFESASGSALNDNDQWVYLIDNTGKLFKATSGPYTNIASYVQMTPDEVVLDPAASGFAVLGAEKASTGDVQQPFVTIRLVGTITIKNIVTPFFLQTSVSQRLIDL